MYEEYAKDPRMKINVGIRRRLAPLLDNGRDEIELLHAILFSLPGAPVLYYGDEIMMGDNVYLGDRDGVRTPMQWTGDRNAGFSRADWAQLYLQPLMDPVYGYQAVNVEAQLRTPTSFLRWLHLFIALRKEHPVFGLGTYEPLRPENSRIFAHIRRFEEDVVLCVHNLANSAQAVELDLSQFVGHGSRGDAGPDAFSADRGAAVLVDARAARVLLVPAEAGRRMSFDERSLIEHVTQQRWYGAKSRGVAHAQVRRLGRAAHAGPAARARARRGALRDGRARPLPVAVLVPRGRAGTRRPRRRPGARAGAGQRDAVGPDACRARTAASSSSASRASPVSPRSSARRARSTRSSRTRRSRSTTRRSSRCSAGSRPGSTRSWSSCASSPTAATRTSPRSAAGTRTPAARWRRRWGSSRSTCRTDRTAGSSRSTSSPSTRSGSSGGSAVSAR